MNRTPRLALAAGIAGALFATVALAGTSAASGAPLSTDVNTGPVRAVDAAAADRVMVFAGDLSTSDQYSPKMSEPVADAYTAAYHAAGTTPDLVTPPYVLGGKLVGPSAPSSSRPFSVAALTDIEVSAVAYAYDAFPSADIADAFIDAAADRVVLESGQAPAGLRTALARRYGPSAITIHLVQRGRLFAQKDGRFNDLSNFEGGSSFHTNTAYLGCTTGFAYTSPTFGDMMITAGHCATVNDTAYASNTTTTMGKVILDTYKAGTGSVLLSGQTLYHGDISAIDIKSGEKAAPDVHNGLGSSTADLPVHGQLNRRLNSSDQFCEDGAVTGEVCGWHVSLTKIVVPVTVDGTTVLLRNVFEATQKNGPCTNGGDSGGPLYAKNSTSITLMVGIHNGGTNGGQGTASNPCVMYGTEMDDIVQAFPGNVKLSS
jgi:hypothetical protein